MKKLLIILCVICTIIPLIVYGVGIVKTVKFNANCINYLEQNNLTSGHTKIFIYRPTNDIGLWYENLKSAQLQLQELSKKEELTELEESNSLMKLRETLLDNQGTVTHPEGIMFHPSYASYFWTAVFIWMLWILAFAFGVVAYEY